MDERLVDGRTSRRMGGQEEPVDGCQAGGWAPDERMNGCMGRASMSTSRGRTDKRTDGCAGRAGRWTSGGQRGAG